MRLALSLVLLLACAHSPPPPPGPRPLSGLNSIARGEANLEIRLLYEIKPDRSIVLTSDLKATGTGTVGPITIDVKLDHFVFEGPSTWTGEVAEGSQETPSITVRPDATGVGWIKVSYRRADGSGDVGVFAPFILGPDELRPCQSADEACKAIHDPTAAP